jgi:hypothetical protein
MTLATSCYGADWKALSKVNDPPNRPSVKTALVATQGMHKLQIQTRIVQYRRALKRDKTSSATARSVLRREIALLEIALENK